MRNKLNANVERKRQFHAFEVYRDLGYGRTFRETARLTGASVGSVSRWARLYQWDTRIQQNTAIVEAKKEAGALVKVDDPVIMRFMNIMDRMEAVIESAFAKGMDGKLYPKVAVENLEDLTKFITEYRKSLESYHRFVAEFKPAEKGNERTGVIRDFNLYMGNSSQAERITMLKNIGGVIGNDKGGDSDVTRGVSDSDSAEVPE